MSKQTPLKKHLAPEFPIKLLKRGRRVDEDMRNTVIHENKVNGLTQEKIAAMVGTNRWTVGKILRKHTLSTGIPFKTCEMGKRVDEDMRNTIVHEHKVNGLTQKEIVVIVGTSQMTVGKILRKHTLSTGIPHKTRKVGKRVDEDMRKTIVHEHINNGLSQRKIADMIGVSDVTVGTILKKHTLSTGIPHKTRKKGKCVDEDMCNTIVHEHINNGLSQEKIADMVGTSQMTVSKILKKHTLSTGIPHKTRKKGKRVDEDMRNTIVHEYKVNGLTQEKIAAMVGTSIATVCNILKASRKNESLEPTKDIETKSIITDEVEPYSQVESQTTTDNEEIKQEHD